MDADFIFPDLSDARNAANEQRRSKNKATPSVNAKPAEAESDPCLITEGAVADAFAAEHRDHLRYDHHAGRWFMWDGTRWRREETRLAFRWAHERAKALAAAADNAKAILGAGKAAFAGGVERLAQSDRAFAVTSGVWDRDLFLLGTPDGTVDLRTGTLRPAEKTDFITKSSAITPVAIADCPQWLAFLKQATNGNDPLIRFLQQWCGYCLTGAISEHALLFVYGAGGNGKSVMLNTVISILDDYAVVASMETFVASSSDRHPTDLAMLRGARLVAASETEDGRAWAESRIKQITGGDKISARFMRQDFFQYLPQFKLTIIGNNQPVLRNVNDAARRRFNMVPFDHKPTVVDKELEDKLRHEWPGILRWMIQGCLDWQQNGLVRPDVVADATNSYFERQDIMRQWVDQCCNRGGTHSDTTATLFRSWTDYALANGEKPETSKWFSQTLEKMGCQPVKNTPGFNGHRGFLGISVKLECTDTSRYPD